jgi:hypothetical protein
MSSITSNADNDSIVAIHGLGGHREWSWRTNNVLWLRDFLPKHIEQARILTYGYDSRYNTTYGPKELSRLTIHDHAVALLGKLALYRMETPVTSTSPHVSSRGCSIESSKERPIIFVAHSFGGIVLKHVCVCLPVLI